MNACMLGAGALLVIRRTVRRPRLTVPTNLQAVIVVDMLSYVLVEPWRQCLVRWFVCRNQQMVLLVREMSFTIAQHSNEAMAMAVTFAFACFTPVRPFSAKSPQLQRPTMHCSPLHSIAEARTRLAKSLWLHSIHCIHTIQVFINPHNRHWHLSCQPEAKC